MSRFKLRAHSSKNGSPSSSTLASSSQLGLPNQVSVLFSRDQRRALYRGGKSQSSVASESLPLLAGQSSPASFYTARQPGDDDEFVDRAPSRDSIGARPHHTVKDYARRLWPAPRLMRTGGMYGDTNDRETEYSEIFLDLVFAACFMKLGQKFVLSGTLLMGEFVLFFFVLWGFWQDVTNYSTRFGMDDVPHMVFFTLYTGSVLGMGASLQGTDGFVGKTFKWFTGCALSATLSLAGAYLRITVQPPTPNVRRFAIATMTRASCCAGCWALLLSPCLEEVGLSDDTVRSLRFAFTATTVVLQHGLDLVSAGLAICCFDDWSNRMPGRAEPSTSSLSGDRRYGRFRLSTSNDLGSPGIVGVSAAAASASFDARVAKETAGETQGNAIASPKQHNRSPQKREYSDLDEDEPSASCGCHILPPMLLPLHIGHFAQRIEVLIMAMMAMCVPVLTNMPTIGNEPIASNFSSIVCMFLSIFCLRKVYFDVEGISTSQWTGKHRVIAFWWLYSHMALALGISILLVAMQTILSLENSEINDHGKLYWYSVGLATSVAAIFSLFMCNHVSCGFGKTEEVVWRQGSLSGYDSAISGNTPGSMVVPSEMVSVDEVVSHGGVFTCPSIHCNLHLLQFLVHAGAVAVLVALAAISTSSRSSLDSVVFSVSLTVLCLLVFIHLWDPMLHQGTSKEPLS